MMSALIAYPTAAPALAGSGRIKAKIRMKLIDHQNHRMRSSVRAPAGQHHHRLRGNAVGAENPVTSRDLHVFVDEPAEPVSS
jgi:hypothetical protein